MTPFTAFERWALSIPVPALELPALENPSDLDLMERADQVGFTLFRDEGDAGLASLLVKLGALDYMEKKTYA